MFLLILLISTDSSWIFSDKDTQQWKSHYTFFFSALHAHLSPSMLAPSAYTTLSILDWTMQLKSKLKTGSFAAKTPVNWQKIEIHIFLIEFNWLSLGEKTISWVMIAIFSDSKEMTASQVIFLNVTLTNYWNKHVSLVKITSFTERGKVVEEKWRWKASKRRQRRTIIKWGLGVRLTCQGLGWGR